MYNYRKYRNLILRILWLFTFYMLYISNLILKKVTHWNVHCLSIIDLFYNLQKLYLYKSLNLFTHTINTNIVLSGKQRHIILSFLCLQKNLLCTSTQLLVYIAQNVKNFYLLKIQSHFFSLHLVVRLYENRNVEENII